MELIIKWAIVAICMLMVLFIALWMKEAFKEEKFGRCVVISIISAYLFIALFVIFK